TRRSGMLSKRKRRLLTSLLHLPWRVMGSLWTLPPSSLPQVIRTVIASGTPPPYSFLPVCRVDVCLPILVFWVCGQVGSRAGCLLSRSPSSRGSRKTERDSRPRQQERQSRKRRGN